jgi:hypothetical protein
VKNSLLPQLEVCERADDVAILRETAIEVLDGAWSKLAGSRLDARVNILYPDRTEKGAELLEWVRFRLPSEKLFASFGVAGLGKVI